MIKPIFHRTLYQRLWQHLAMHIGRTKQEAIDLLFNQEEERKFGLSNCTACQYDHEMRKMLKEDKNELHDTCEFCPLEQEHRGKKCLNGLFSDWEFHNGLYRLIESKIRFKELSLEEEDNVLQLREYVRNKAMKIMDMEPRKNVICL